MTDMTTPIAAVQPVATLREEDGYVLGIYEAGTTSLEFVSYVIRRCDDRIRDHFGDNVEGETGQKLVGWMPIPYTDEAVLVAIATGEEISNPGKPVLEGDPVDHLIFVKQVAYDLAGAIGPRRAMLKLHATLDDDIDGPRLPDGDTHTLRSLRRVREAITKWTQDDLGDVEAIDAIRMAMG